MITREQLDQAQAFYQQARDDNEWWTERGRGVNNAAFQAAVDDFKAAIFPIVAERMMWEAFPRDLGPAVGMRETLEKLDRMYANVRDQLEQGLFVFGEEAGITRW